MSSTITTSLNSMNYKITKIFQNPNINFFIIMNLILVISCYTFLNSDFKNIISSFVANPIIILFSLIIIIIVGYYNINVAVLSLLLLFVILFGSTNFNTNTNTNTNNNNHKIENFTNDNEDDDDNDKDNDDDEDEKESVEDTEKKYEKKMKEEKTKSREDTISSFKDVILGSFNKYKNMGETNYKNDIIENKKIIYENEKKNNKNNKNKNSKFMNVKDKNSKTKSSKNKEEFQTIDTRKFDPTKEEDTNLLITKEVLQDMINRIEYKFEANTYLKKYLKHRIEEIVELNKLLDEDEE